MPVFNWWDRGPHGPALEDVRRRTQACVMGGIDQTLLARRSPAFLKAHAAEGLQLGGPGDGGVFRRALRKPECVQPSSINRPNTERSDVVRFRGAFIVLGLPVPSAGRRRLYHRNPVRKQFLVASS